MEWESSSRIFRGLLRHARLARLQKDVDLHRLVAEEHGAKVLVIAHRAAGQQEHVRLVVGNVHRAFQEFVGSVRTALRCLHAKAEHALTDFRGRHLELDRHRLAIAQQNLVGEIDDRALAAVLGILGVGAVAGQKFHPHGFPLHAKALDRSVHRVAFVGKDAGGNIEIGHADIDRLLLRADADGVDRNVRLAGKFLRRVRRDTGVQAAVTDEHDAGNGRVPLLLQELLQGLAQAGIGAAGHKLLLPIGRRRPACRAER